MKYLVIMAWVLGGCAHIPVESSKGTIVEVKAAVDSASLSVQKVTQRTAAAKASLQVASAKSRQLMLIANAAERPLLTQLNTALEESKTELNAAQEQIKITNEALTDSTRGMDMLQKEFRVLGEKLTAAQDETERIKANRDFWRASTWKLALLSLAFCVWTFRKPLFAMCGGLVG